MSSIFYIDGEFVRSDDASIPASDLAILRGYGVFDFMRTYGGKPFHLDWHLKRLGRSAQLIDLGLPVPLDRIRDLTLETLARNDYPEANVRIVVTGGSSEDNITPNGGARLLVMVTPWKPMPAHWYTDGIKIITHQTDRYLPEAKTINYIPAILALKKAREQDAVDAIYIDREGRALEGTTTNLFAFFGDRLVTAGDNILRGITRQTILDLATDHFQVEETDLPLVDLLRADEVFISSSNKEVCPVRQIDDQRVGTSVPGPNTRVMMAQFAQMAAAYAQS